MKYISQGKAGMTMGRKITTALCVISSAAIMLFTVFSGPVEVEEQPEIRQETAAMEEIDDEPPYTLTEESGSIVIVYKGETYGTDIPTSGLRQYDRDLLKSGIKAETYEELLMLLEDLNS